MEELADEVCAAALVRVNPESDAGIKLPAELVKRAAEFLIGREIEMVCNACCGVQAGGLVNFPNRSSRPAIEHSCRDNHFSHFQAPAGWPDQSAGSVGDFPDAALAVDDQRR